MLCGFTLFLLFRDELCTSCIKQKMEPLPQVMHTLHVAIERRGAQELRGLRASMFSIVQVPLPTWSKHQILVKVEAVALQPEDIAFCEGRGRSLHWGYRKTMGFSFSGKVMSIGERCTSFREGDHVFGSLGWRGVGACSEYIVVTPKQIALRPTYLTAQQAVSLLEPQFCSYPIAELFTPYNTVLVYGIDTRVGRQLESIAASKGSSVVGATRFTREGEGNAIDDYDNHQPAGIKEKGEGEGKMNYGTIDLGPTQPLRTEDLLGPIEEDKYHIICWIGATPTAKDWKMIVPKMEIGGTVLHIDPQTTQTSLLSMLEEKVRDAGHKTGMFMVNGGSYIHPTSVASNAESLRSLRSSGIETRVGSCFLMSALACKDDLETILAHFGESIALQSTEGRVILQWD